MQSRCGVRLCQHGTRSMRLPLSDAHACCDAALALSEHQAQPRGAEREASDFTAIQAPRRLQRLVPGCLRPLWKAARATSTTAPPRGQHPRSDNKMLVRSVDWLAPFDAYRPGGRPRGRVTAFASRDHLFDGDLGSGMDWSNLLLGGRWQVIVGRGGALEVSASGTRFAEDVVDLPARHSRLDVENRFGRVNGALDLTTRWAGSQISAGCRSGPARSVIAFRRRRATSSRRPRGTFDERRSARTRNLRARWELRLYSWGCGLMRQAGRLLGSRG